MVESDSRSPSLTRVASAKSIGRSAYRFMRSSIARRSSSVIGRTVMASERSNFHALALAREFSPRKWKSSARTAAVVARGKRTLENDRTQASCQESLLSSRARIAPVSIRPRGCMLLFQTSADTLPNLVGGVWAFIQEDRSEGPHRFLPHPILDRLIFHRCCLCFLSHKETMRLSNWATLVPSVRAASSSSLFRVGSTRQL